MLQGPAIRLDGKSLYFVIRDVLKAQKTQVYGKIYESTIKFMFYSDGTWIYGPGWGLEVQWNLLHLMGSAKNKAVKNL